MNLVKNMKILNRKIYIMFLKSKKWMTINTYDEFGI